jgi:hypothetical protein
MMAALGCGAESGDGATFGFDPTDSGAADSTSSTGTSSDGGESSVDVGPGTSAHGCDKIDFLFVIDSSPSMAAHQAALLASFGPFMYTIFGTVQAHDYHIMVTDSDAGDDVDACEASCASTEGEPWCGDFCDVEAELDLTCERSLGAGEVAPYNGEATNAICLAPGTDRFLSSDAEPAEIAELFGCIAKVGTGGSGYELPISAIAEAVTTQSEPGGCNEGFLRDDAILVVTFISDDVLMPGIDDDASTVGSPQAWYDAIVSAKDGKADEVVVLGILWDGTSDASCVYPDADGEVLPADRFVEFVDLFGDRGSIGDVCSDAYDPFFAQAVGLIDTACDEFVPEG